MYAQIDGVSMDSPLGPVLANICVSFHENFVFSATANLMYTYAMLTTLFPRLTPIDDKEAFHVQPNSLHPSIQFTFKVENDLAFLFLDVLLERKESSFITCVYRTPTFTGLYTNWNPFVSKSRKMNLISTLVHHALMRCSPCRFDKEIEIIYSIFSDNGYPENVIKRTVEHKIKCFMAPVAFAPPALCPIYFKLAGQEESDASQQCVGLCYIGCFGG